MGPSEPSNWRSLFEHKRPDRPHGEEVKPQATPAPPLGGYDDGYTPALPAQPSPNEISEEAAVALADDPREYQPWLLQRGRSRPAMMLHMRRLDPRSGLWRGWALAYPCLLAIEYVGHNQISLDFGARQFMLQGHDLGDLIDHLQAGTVLCVQEFTPTIWPRRVSGPTITAIRDLTATPGAEQQT